jgi:hypothetical protein
MGEVKRFYCVRRHTEGMGGGWEEIAVRASEPDPEGNLTVRRVDPATELLDWRRRGPDDQEPAEYVPPAP